MPALDLRLQWRTQATPASLKWGKSGMYCAVLLCRSVHSSRHNRSLLDEVCWVPWPDMLCSWAILRGGVPGILTYLTLHTSEPARVCTQERLVHLRSPGCTHSL